MKQSDFIEILNQSKFWIKDRFGNFKYDGQMKTVILVSSQFKGFGECKLKTPRDVVRLKIQATSVRLETQIKVCDKNEWFKLNSDYFKNLTLDDFNGQPVIVFNQKVAIPV